MTSQRENKNQILPVPHNNSSYETDRRHGMDIMFPIMSCLYPRLGQPADWFIVLGSLPTTANSLFLCLQPTSFDTLWLLSGTFPPIKYKLSITSVYYNSGLICVLLTIVYDNTLITSRISEIWEYVTSLQ